MSRPGASRGWLLAATGGAAAALLAIAAACGGSASAPALSPPPTPSPPATSAATATPDEAASLAAIGAAMEELRGLEANVAPVLRLVDRAGMQAALLSELDDPTVAQQLARQGALLRLLGLLPPGADLEGLYREFLGQQVLGLYLPKSNEMLVLEGGASAPGRAGGALEEVTLAHEYVHFLQDQRFDLARLQEEAGPTFDRQLALAALIEGDATEAQSRYVAERVRSADALALLVGAVLTGGLSGGDVPGALAQISAFPYRGGAQFAAELRAAGGQEAVDAAFASPPTTTEQVLHTDKYLAGEGALPVTLPPLAAAAGPAWEPLGDEVLGEWLIERWLIGLGGPELAGDARDWGGDAARVLRRRAADGGDEHALALMTRRDPRAHALLLGLDRALRLAEPAGRSELLSPPQASVSRAESERGLPVRVWRAPGGVLAHSTSAFDDYLAIAIAPEEATAIALVNEMLDALALQQAAPAGAG